MQIFNSVVSSVIIPSPNVLTPHISKSHLPIVSLNVRELKLMLKRVIKKNIAPSPCVGDGSPTPPVNGALPLYTGMHFPNVVISE